MGRTFANTLDGVEVDLDNTPEADDPKDTLVLGMPVVSRIPRRRRRRTHECDGEGEYESSECSIHVRLEQDKDRGGKGDTSTCDIDADGEPSVALPERKERSIVDVEETGRSISQTPAAGDEKDGTHLKICLVNLAESPYARIVATPFNVSPNNPKMGDLVTDSDRLSSREEEM